MLITEPGTDYDAEWSQRFRKMPVDVTRPAANTLLLLSFCTLLGACSSAVRWEPAAVEPAVTPSPDPRPAPSPSLGATVVQAAYRQLGAPYRYGGATPRGFDCSGLVQYAYRRAGRRVPRTTTALYRTARPVDLGALRPGDLLFFHFDDKIGHVAIYAGGDRFIHAPSSGKQVVTGSLKNGFWRERLVGAGRLF
ncbi:MAG: C40 family peptidase [Gammaproteobacteria bacterium]